MDIRQTVTGKPTLGGPSLDKSTFSQTCKFFLQILKIDYLLKTLEIQTELESEIGQMKDLHTQLMEDKKVSLTLIILLVFSKSAIRILSWRTTFHSK